MAIRSSLRLTALTGTSDHFSSAMEVSHIEEAIAKTGWGLYSRFLMGFSGMCCFSNGLVAMSMPLYLPLVICDIPLSNSLVYLIEIGMPIGVIAGSFISAISDAVGRKTLMTFGLLMGFVNSLAVSFAYNPIGIILAQIILGMGLCAGENAVRVHLAETLPISRRTKCMIILDIFGSVGCFVAVALSMICMPFVNNHQAQNARIFTWRMLFSFPGIFTIVMACVSPLIMESPRYLVYERRTAQALGVLKQIFAINNSRMFLHYPITERDLQGKIADFGINVEGDMPNHISTKRCIIIIKRIKKSTCAVMKYFMDISLLVSLLRAFTTMGPYFLTMLLVKTLEISRDYTVESLEVLHFDNPILQGCEESTFEFKLYWEFLVFTVFYTLGLILTVALTSFIDHKYIMVVGLFISGTCSTILAFIYASYLYRFIISAILITSFATFKTCLNVASIEIFPTAVRGTACGETLILSKIFDSLLWTYMGLPSSWLFVGFGLMMEVGAVLSFGLPKMKDRPMVD